MRNKKLHQSRGAVGAYATCGFSSNQKLEEELNAPVFLRKRGEIILSEEGEIALLYVKRMRALCEKMREKIKNAKTNIYKIRIGITHTQESGFMIEALSKIALGDDNITITFITDTIKIFMLCSKILR